MNEYLVAVYINEEKTVAPNVLVEAPNKDEAVKKAREELEKEGFKTYGYDWCDLI